MRQLVRAVSIFGGLLLANLLITSSLVAGGHDPGNLGERIGITLTDQGAPLVGSEVVVFFSTGAKEATTDEEGHVSFRVDGERGFWVEVDGERLNEFFFVDQRSFDIDVAVVGTMEWPGR